MSHLDMLKNKKNKYFNSPKVKYLHRLYLNLNYKHTYCPTRSQWDVKCNYSLPGFLLTSH